MLAATMVKMSCSEKKSEQEHIQHFLHKLKRVTGKFLGVSRRSRAKQRQRNVLKKACKVVGCGHIYDVTKV